MDRRSVIGSLFVGALLNPKLASSADMPAAGNRGLGRRRLTGECITTQPNSDNRYVDFIDNCSQPEVTLEVDVQWRYASGVNADRLTYRISKNFGNPYTVRRRNGQTSDPYIISERPYTRHNFHDVSNYVDVIQIDFRGQIWNGFQNRTASWVFIEYRVEEEPGLFFTSNFTMRPGRRPVTQKPITMNWAEEEPD